MNSDHDEKTLLSQPIRLQIELKPILTWSVVLIAAILLSGW